MSPALTILVSVFLLSLSCSSGFQINQRQGCSGGKFLNQFKRQPAISNRKGMNLEMRWGLKGPQVGQGQLEEGQALRDTVPFEIRGFSLPVVVFTAGVLLTASSFVGFFSTDGGSDGAISSLGFVYGIPVFLIGLSLWYAELAPVPVVSSEAGDRAWENKATETLIKVKADVTRHRYGDDAHLDSTLEALGLKLQGKKFPKLLSLTQEELENGELVFTMAFQSLDTPYKIWAEPSRVKKYANYFGPNIDAEIFKVDSSKRIVGLKLTTLAPGQVPVAKAQPAEEEDDTEVKQE